MPHILLKYDKIGSTTSSRISFFIVQYPRTRHSAGSHGSSLARPPNCHAFSMVQFVFWRVPSKLGPKDLQTYKSKYLKRVSSSK
jgi:hypothetical protein